MMAERGPELRGSLFQLFDHVLEAYKNFGGFGWFHYDESFHQKLAVHPSLHWGMKDVGLQLNLILPQKLSGIRATQGMQQFWHTVKGYALRLMNHNASGAHRVATDTNACFVQGGIQ